VSLSKVKRGIFNTLFLQSNEGQGQVNNCLKDPPQTSILPHPAGLHCTYAQLFYAFYLVGTARRQVKVSKQINEMQYFQLRIKMGRHILSVVSSKVLKGKLDEGSGSWPRCRY
jgi:hypothetical protein